MLGRGSVWRGCYICLAGVFLVVAGRAANNVAEFEAIGTAGGCVVHLGCGDGLETVQLHQHAQVVVQGLDADFVQVAAAQKNIAAAGKCGAVSVAYFDGEHLPYIDNLVNVLVVEKPYRVSKQEMLRVVAPLGSIWFQQDGEWKKIVKPWPKNGMDEWTHWLHGPDNNAVAQERGVDFMRNLQWVQPPKWMASHNLNPGVSAMVSAKGRVFSIINEMPAGIGGLDDQWVLSARDAFNGIVLWKRPIKEWGWKEWSDMEFNITMRFVNPFQVMRRMIAVEDRLFVTPGFSSPVSVVDAATGETIRELAGTEKAFEILHINGMLLLAVNHAIDTDGNVADVSVMAVNPDTGRILWKKDGFQGVSGRISEQHKFSDLFMTAGGGQVAFVNADEMISLRLNDGAERWRIPRPEKTVSLSQFSIEERNTPVKSASKSKKKKTEAKAAPKKPTIPVSKNAFHILNNCAVVYQDGIVFLSEIKDEPENFRTSLNKTLHLWAIDAKTGKKVWTYDGATYAHYTPPDLFVSDGLVWVISADGRDYKGLALKTGKEKKSYPIAEIFLKGGGHQRCFRNKATLDQILVSRRNTETINLTDGELSEHSWIKGNCGYGFMPANGMVYFPPHNCACNSRLKLTGFRALTTAEYPANCPASRLHKGPAFRSPVTEKQSKTDWIMHRSGPSRNGSVSATFSLTPKQKWSARIGGKLTQAIAAQNSVYLAEKETHQVFSLNQDNGKIQWKFTAGGRIDSAPSFYKGRIIFGSRDGYVYALHAKTGKLIWKYLAAPYHLNLMAYSQLESAWPVSGSVLVYNDYVYAIAGRSPHLNGGMYLYALDPATGSVIHQKHIQADISSEFEVDSAALPDLLTAVDGKIYMRNMVVDDELKKPVFEDNFKNILMTQSGFRTGSGFLDDSWFNSSMWMLNTIQAHQLVFDKDHAYGIMAHKKNAQSAGHDVFYPGQKGYELFSSEIPKPGVLVVKEAGKALHGHKENISKKPPRGPKPQKNWSVQVPIRAQSILLSGNGLYLTGVKDMVDKDDPWGHLEGRLGGVLAVYSKADGSKQSELPLPAAPIHDGISAAGNKLFIVTVDGELMCFE